MTVQNTDQVNAGDILVRLAPSDARISLAETEAKLTQVERRVEQLFAIDAQNAVRLKQAEIAFAVVGIAAVTDSAPAFLTDSNAGATRASPRQRLPVRLALDPGSTKDHPLAVGLAMTVTIHLDEDTSSGDHPVSGSTPARFRHQF